MDKPHLGVKGEKLMLIKIEKKNEREYPSLQIKKNKGKMFIFILFFLLNDSFLGDLCLQMINK